MYTTSTTGSDKPPKRPVITSLAGALTEVRHWLTENQLNEVRDGDGLAWDLAVKVVQVPDPANPKGLLWQVRLMLKTQAEVAQLLETGTLDAVKDARLIEMIASKSIDLAMRPLTYHVASEEAARSLLVDVLPKLKASFARNSLAEVKRNLVGRYVDEGCRFGARS